MSIRFKLGESEWMLDFDTIKVDESIELCKLTGYKWGQLCKNFDNIGELDALAVKAFFWLARRKSGEKLAFDGEAMNFTWSQLRLEPVMAVNTDQDTQQAPDPTPATSKTSTSQKR